MSVFKLKDVLISLVLSFLLLFGIIFPLSSVTAQNYDGDYLCFGITKDGGLSATTLTHDEMVQKGILAPGEDSNPRGAWFVGTRIGDTSRWSFEKYARFKKVENKWVPDPEGEQMPYGIGRLAGGEPHPIVNPYQGALYFIVNLGEWWP